MKTNTNIKQIRNSGNRILYRKCGTCGREFQTTSKAYHRILHDENGYHTTYYCSINCKKKSYIRDIYGNSTQKRIEYERKRYKSEEYKAKRKAWNKAYYERNKEQEKARVKKYREEHYEQCLEAVRYNHKKHKLLNNINKGIDKNMGG